MSEKIAIIVGAGPAGLTAAYELLKKTKIRPIVFELTPQVGGLCRTVNHNGNRMDLGGHRFFSKSDRVLDWWSQILPVERVENGNGKIKIGYQNKTHFVQTNAAGPSPKETDKVTLIRTRRSRIYYAKKFFDYPLNLHWSALRKLGFVKTIKIVASYLKSLLFPICHEKNLEDFYVNRFGKELYKTFFKSYTQKVWGAQSHEIDPQWGAQRIRGLNLKKTLLHPLKKLVSSSIGEPEELLEKNVEPSLIQRFLYPKLGPGQLWEEVARQVTEKGGEIFLNHRVVTIHVENSRVTEMQVQNKATGEIKTVKADFLFSTMPIRELIPALGFAVPDAVRHAAQGLCYRDFIVVGVLVKKITLAAESHPTDNWIYIQDERVQMGRIQIFNNWSPYLVKDPNTIWLGLEYFCNEGDSFWGLKNHEIAAFAQKELAQLGFVKEEDILDSHVERVPKAYPAYFSSHDRLETIKRYTDTLENLFLIGRNGMHKYNNQDHSMLSAMASVENIVNGIKTKQNIWAVNADAEYIEEKQ